MLTRRVCSRIVQRFVSSVPIASGSRKQAENDIDPLSIQNVIKETRENFNSGFELYQKIRDNGREVPHWGALKLSSIVMSDRKETIAENILKDQMECNSGYNPFLRVSDEQICASIDRVLKKDLDAAYTFYDFLLKYEFCMNRDVFLSMLIEKTVEKEGVQEAIEKLRNLIRNEKRKKNMTLSAFYILSQAYKDKKFEEVIEKLETFLKPSLIKNLAVFVVLNSEQPLTVADYCKRTEFCFTTENVEVFVKLAKKLKSTTPLLNLFEIDPFVKIPKKSYFSIFDELLKIAGKKKSTEVLKHVTSIVANCSYLQANERKILVLKIRHFYKCLNLRTPDELQNMLERI